MNAYEAAFPGDDGAKTGTDGLSKREWFAGMALIGLLAFSPEDNDRQLTCKDAADQAVEYADAVLARLKEVPS